MNEDAQPNERPLNKKGAGIPAVRSTANRGRGRGTFQRGEHGHLHPSPRYHRLPNESSGNRPPTRSHNYPPYQHPPKRLEYSSNNVSYTKRRPMNHDFNAEHGPRPSTSAMQLPQSYKPRYKAKKPLKRKASNEDIELLIDIPFHCRKEAAGYEAQRQKWEDVQSRELSVKTGAPLRFGGYFEDCARFIFDDNFAPPLVEDNGNISTTTKPSIEAMRPPNGSIMSDTDINYEIIIAENVEDLGVNYESPIIITHPDSSEVNITMQEYRHIIQATHITEPPEPLRVFKSGFFSLPSSSSSGALGSLNVESSTSYIEPISSHREPTLNATLTDPTLFRTTHTLAEYNHEIQDADNSSQRSTGYTMALEGAPIQILTPQNDKLRRILAAGTKSVVSVSMRGLVNCNDLIPFRHRRTLSLLKSSTESIDDACLLWAGDEYVTILGHARDREQLSWCHSQVNQKELCSLRRPWNNFKKGGVSAVTSMLHPLQFATGGYDHVVHLWEAESDFSSASSRELGIKHTSQVQSLLAIKDSSHKLVSAGADCNVHIWDLSSERVVNTVKTSNPAYHVHQTASPFCTLLEVAHRELQFEVRDHRLVPAEPVLRFGYTSNKVHGRYLKGATSSDLFACGGRDGSIRLWDLRNVKGIPAIATPGERKIIQVIFTPSQLVVCSESGKMNLVRYDGALNS